MAAGNSARSRPARCSRYVQIIGAARSPSQSHSANGSLQSPTCPTAMDQRHSSTRSARPALTGFCSMYTVAPGRRGSLITNDANRRAKGARAKGARANLRGSRSAACTAGEPRWRLAETHGNPGYPRKCARKSEVHSPDRCEPPTRIQAMLRGQSITVTPPAQNTANTRVFRMLEHSRPAATAYDARSG